MKKESGIRNITLVLIMITIISLETFIGFIILEKQNEDLLNHHYAEFHKIDKSYNEVLAKELYFYKNRAEMILSCSKVIDAIKLRDRDKLHSLMLEKWNILKKENHFFKIMQFHLPDGKSFLRMHQPDAFGDPIADVRPMLQEIHKNRTQVFGVEKGSFFTPFRVIVPIFDKNNSNEYFGALELGFRTDQIIDNMSSMINIGGFVLVKENDIYQFPEENNISISGFRYLYSVGKNLELLNFLKDTNYKFEPLSKIEFKERIYLIHSITLFDFQGVKSVQNIIFEDVTTDIIKADEILFQIIFFSIIVAIISFIFMRIIVLRMENALKEVSSELETIFNTVQDGVLILDKDTNFLMVNNGYLQMTGYSRAEILQKSCFDLTPYEFREETSKRFKSVFQVGYSRDFNKKCLKKDGSFIDLILSFTLMPDKERVVVSATDITDRKKREEKIKNYLNIIDNNILTTDLNSNFQIIRFSTAFSNLTNFRRIDLVGFDVDLLSANREFSIKNEIKSLLNGDDWFGEVEILKRDGSTFWSELIIHKSHNNSLSNSSGYTLIHKDVTDKKLVEELSIRDELTTLYNRRFFNKIIDKELNRAKRESDYLSLMILDVDHFKQYNDTYGHQEGDTVLHSIGVLLNGSCSKRASDFAFRLGGEEFGVLFSRVDEEKSFMFADKIRKNIEDNLKIEHSGNSASKYVTVSIGLVTAKCNQISLSDDQIYKMADDKLYEAKKKGRNRICQEVIV
jgi:diguanylate cyclase (GGDEF)-like protein/PAS domain S-box-containing protein